MTSLEFICSNCEYHDDDTCKLKPPADVAGMGYWLQPMVEDDDWCGQHSALQMTTFEYYPETDHLARSLKTLP